LDLYLRIILRTEKKEGVLGNPSPTKGDIKKSTGGSHVMAIQNKPNFKRKCNSWKKKGKDKYAISKQTLKVKAGSAVDNECFHCHELGH
jgi:hypothetical protein